MTQHDDLFTGRVISVYVSLDGEHGRGLVMRDCSLRDIAGRTFLMGTCAETGVAGDDAWMAGVDAAIPWDTVTSVFFKTQEQYSRLKTGR